jgi:probable HAF family extracellular repeat protein
MKRSFTHILCAALVLAAALSLGARQASAAASLAFPTYTITDLGTFGGSYSSAAEINAAGQVVGAAYTVNNVSRAFLYSNGAMTDLGTLGGDWSVALAINASGQIVGNAATAEGLQHAFLYADGGMTDLGTLGGQRSLAGGLNDSGQIVGWSYTAGGVYHAFLHTNGVMTDLGTLGGPTSIASSLNASGQVVGYSDTTYGADNRWHAFLYDGGVMTDLGTLGGANSIANAINASGQIVGASHPADSTTYHAFLYSDGVMTDLGTLGGDTSAFNLNDFGQVVGFSFTADNRQHAFLYQGGLMQDLNSLIPIETGWELVAAAGINNSGRIVGRGVINGQTHAFLLTPRSASQLLDDLTGLVRSFSLPKGIENSLIVKLQNAQNALAGGDADTARHLLSTFIKEVNAQTGKTLTAAQADQLVAGTNAIIAALSG